MNLAVCGGIGSTRVSSIRFGSNRFGSVRPRIRLRLEPPSRPSISTGHQCSFRFGRNFTKRPARNQGRQRRREERERRVVQPVAPFAPQWHRTAPINSPTANHTRHARHHTRRFVKWNERRRNSPKIAMQQTLHQVPTNWTRLLQHYTTRYRTARPFSSPNPRVSTLRDGVAGGGKCGMSCVGRPGPTFASLACFVLGVQVASKRFQDKNRSMTPGHLPAPQTMKLSFACLLP